MTQISFTLRFNEEMLKIYFVHKVQTENRKQNRKST